MPTKLTIDVSKDGYTGKLQVSINEVDESGSGHGYRLLGPKFLGASETLAAADLDQRDADEIRKYLDKAFPAAAPTVCGFETDDGAAYYAVGDSEAGN